MKKFFSIVLACILCVSLCACGKGKVKSKFKEVKSEVLQYAGQLSSGDNYFSVDTYPYDETKMDPAVIKMLEDDTRENTLKGIQYANNEFGFASYVYSDMLQTTAQMGRQTAENENYKVSWTYHPDRGLEVTYEIK